MSSDSILIKSRAGEEEEGHSRLEKQEEQRILDGNKNGVLDNQQINNGWLVWRTFVEK